MIEETLSRKPKKNGIKLFSRYVIPAVSLVGAALLLSMKRRSHTAPPGSSHILNIIERQKEKITLAWPDKGTSYRVYRNQQLVYSGVEPLFTDNNLFPGTIYTYTIETLGTLKQEINRIKLLTATATGENKSENPLADTTFTTIVSKGQISLEWDSIEGIEEFTIERNGLEIARVKECSFIDQNISKNKEYTYTIRGKRPIQYKERQLSEGEALVAGTVGVLKKDSSIEQTAMEDFQFTQKIAPLKVLLKPVKEPSMMEINWQLRYTTFLPQKKVKNPNIASNAHIFKGDHRGFNPDSPRFRTRADVFVNNKSDELVKLNKEVGKTVSYKWFGKRKKEGWGSDNGIKIEKVFTTEDKISFQLIHSVGNPLVISPAIDYQLTASFYKNGVMDLSGVHDQAPHQEVYLRPADEKDWMTIHQSRNKGLEMMADPLADQLWRFIAFIK